MSRRTKIVATIGPACDTDGGLDDVLRAGVDVVRLNLSHGPLEEHLHRLASVRAAADRVGRVVVVLADGGLSLRVDQVEAVVRCTIESGGMTTGRPGVHLPSERFRLSAPTAEDLVLAQAMAAAGVDFIGVSFVRSADDLRQVRDAIRPSATRLVAKIETTGAINDLTAITAVSDAVMVARGDLGIEWPLEDVPHLQKRIIRHCVSVGVPVIT